MNADVKGALEQLDRSWRAFIHNGQKMSKIEVKTVLEYAMSKGYESIKDIPNNEIDNVLINLNLHQ